MPHIETRDTKFFFQQVGQGPDVMLLHGVTGNMAVWMLSGLMNKLSPQFRVTAYDMRGHGYSATPESDYTSADMAADLAAIHGELGLPSVYLMGHSFGGVVALHAARQYPDIVAGVILSDPFIPALRHLQSDPRKWRGFDDYKENAATAGMIVGGNLWDLDEMLEQAATLSEERRQMFVQRAGQGALDRLVRLHGTTCGTDVAKIAGLTVDEIANVQQPVVCLYGEFSPFLPMCHELSRILPNCIIDIIPDAQHFGFEENPSEFIDRVEFHFCQMTGKSPSAPAKPVEGQRRNIMTDSDSV